MALIHKQQKIVREIIQQGGGHTARFSAGEHCRIVLDTLAHAHLVEHFNVVIGALSDALGFDELALCGELLHLRVTLGTNLFQRCRLLLGADDVVAGREDGHMLDHILLGTGKRIELGDAVDLVPEKLHPDGKLAHIGKVDVHDIAVDAELIAHKIHIIAFILQRHKLLAQRIALHLHAGAQADDHAAVVDRIAQRVDAGHRSYDDHVPPLRKCRRGRVAQTVDLVIDGAVLFNIGVGAGDIGFRLVVIVVADEILHRIVGEKGAELGAQLRRQCFIVGQHQRGAVAFCDHICHGKGLAAASNAQQGLAAVAALHALHQCFNSLRLVAGGLVRGYQFKFFVCHLPSPLRPLRKEPQSVVFYVLIIAQQFYNVNSSL